MDAINEAIASLPFLATSVIAVAVALAVLGYRLRGDAALKADVGQPTSQQLPAGSAGRAWKGWGSETTKENSYYFAHSRANDGLAASDYQMEKPKLLSRSPSEKLTSSPVAVPVTHRVF